MTKLASRSYKLSGVLAFEELPEYGVCRENVTVVVQSGMDVGAVVQRTLVGGTGTATAGTNTGNPTFGAITAASYAQVGTYKVVFTAATAFNIYNPAGALVGTGATGTATVPANAGGLTFTITAGGTAAVAGDSFTIAVTGTVKYVWVQASMVSSLDSVVGVVIESVKDVPSLSAGDQTLTVLLHGWSGVVGASLLYKDALSASQQAVVQAALKARRIVTRTKV